MNTRGEGNRDSEIPRSSVPTREVNQSKQNGTRAQKEKEQHIAPQSFFFLSNACYRTSVFWYHYFALLVVVHLNRKSVLFDDTPFVLVINVNSEYYNRSTVQCILQIQNIKRSTGQCICKTINNISVL